MKTVELTGTIVFDPVVEGQSSIIPFWAMVMMDGDICKYYMWWLEKRFGLKLQKPLWGPHISFIRGEACHDWDKVKAKYDGQEIKFSYELDIKSNGKHWWLRVTCDALKDIRKELDLPRENGVGLHLTIGNPGERHRAHSEYIYKTCLLLGI
jgi:hypothetical protein